MRAIAVLGLLALSACANIPLIGDGAPRPECEEPVITVYFEPGRDALPDTAAPLIRHAKEAVDQCRAQGGRLHRVVVTAFPDAETEGADADRAALGRAEAVVAALVEAGLPPSKVVAVDYRRAAEDDVTHVMRRHADISLRME